MYKDPALTRFKKTNLYYTEDKFLIFQDPTYLGFKLFFSFDQADSGLLGSEDNKNSALSYLIARGEDVRADYLRKFKALLSGINSRCPWFFQAIEGLENAWKHGFEEKDFKGLSYDGQIMKILCLDESIDLRVTALMDLYRKACYDWPNKREIVPENLRRFMVRVYVYEARDINRAGSTQPTEVNQQQQKNNEFLLGKDPLANGSQNELDYVNPNISRVMFQLGYCMFKPDESGAMFGGLSHKDMKLNSQSIVFEYRTVHEDNIYNNWSTDKKVSDYVNIFMDSLALDNPNVLSAPQAPENSNGFTPTEANNPYYNQITGNPPDIDRQRLQSNAERSSEPAQLGNQHGESTSLTNSARKKPSLSSFGNAAENFVTGAISREINAQINSLFLGNVFGFSLGSALNALENPSQAIANLVNGNFPGFDPSPSLQNSTRDVDSLGNVIGNEASLTNNTNDVDNLGNVHG
jgi:hypothetical protein